MNKYYLSLTISTVLIISACGGSSNNVDLPNNPPVLQPTVVIENGTFYAGSISSIQYSSGGTSGTLSSDGAFQYEVIDGNVQTVSFSVAGITLGSGVGKSTMTPIDITPNGNVNATEVLNKVALLKVLAEEPGSKLSLKPEQRLLDNASNFSWPQPDFSLADFDSSVEMVQILGDVNVFLAEQRSIPATAEASAFFASRVLCAASGIYYGDIEGGDTGHVTFGLNPINGGVTTLGWSDGDQNIIFVQTPVVPEFNSTVDFTTGASLNGYVFTSTIEGFTQASGTWANSTAQTNGSFTASHLNRDLTAKHHFSAAYVAVFPVFGPGPAGTYSFNLYDDGSVVGTQVNITFGDTTTTAITGTWVDNVLTASVDGGAAINAILDFDNMTMFGQWSDTNLPITSGGITGTGCQLN